MDETPESTPEPPAAEIGAAEVLTEEEERGRRKAKILLILLAVLAIIAVILIYRGCTGNAPIPGFVAPKLPHYTFSIYGTDRPLGVTVSPSGDRIYVTESDGDRLVKVFDESGNRVDTLKPPGHTGQWRSPIYPAVDPMNGDVYVSDRLRESVDIYTSTGKYKGKFRPRARRKLGGGMKPLGVAFDTRANLYLTDVSGRPHRVLVFDRNGKLLRKLRTRDQYSFPNGIAVDSPGNVFVADSNNGRLVIFDSAGKPIASIRRGVGDGDLGLPRGVAVEADGRLYVADTSNQTVKVYKFQNKGSKIPSFIGSFGQEGEGDGMFEYPNGVATDGKGRIYVTDRENNRVQVWKRY